MTGQVCFYHVHYCHSFDYFALCHSIPIDYWIEYLADRSEICTSLGYSNLSRWSCKFCYQQRRQRKWYSESMTSSNVHQDKGKNDCNIFEKVFTCGESLRISVWHERFIKISKIQVKKKWIKKREEKFRATPKKYDNRKFTHLLTFLKNPTTLWSIGSR